MSRFGDTDVASIDTLLNFEYCSEHYFSANFHFLKNDKSCGKDFSIINTISHGLSFHSIETTLSLDNCWWCYMLFPEYMTTVIRQVSRISTMDSLESSLI